MWAKPVSLRTEKKLSETAAPWDMPLILVLGKCKRKHFRLEPKNISSETSAPFSSIRQLTQQEWHLPPYLVDFLFYLWQEEALPMSAEEPIPTEDFRTDFFKYQSRSSTCKALVVTVHNIAGEAVEPSERLNKWFRYWYFMPRYLYCRQRGHNRMLTYIIEAKGGSFCKLKYAIKFWTRCAYSSCYAR
jgi:hypothetical protein